MEFGSSLLQNFTQKAYWSPVGGLGCNLRNIGEISKQLHPISEGSPIACLLCKTKCGLNVKCKTHKNIFIFLSFPSLSWENVSSIICDIPFLMQSMSRFLLLQKVARTFFKERISDLQIFCLPKGGCVPAARARVPSGKVRTHEQQQDFSCRQQISCETTLGKTQRIERFC